MPGFDSLIGKSLSEIITTDLGQKTAEKIEQRLFEKYGMSLNKAVEDFPKVDSVLREFFGDGAAGIERKVLQQIMIIEQAKKETKEWITIEDRTLIKLILESLGDDDKKNILNTVTGTSKLISTILDDCRIPQTSGYRKINSLIRDGFLIVNGYSVTHDGKRVNKYMSIFENIGIHMEKHRVIVQVQLTKESMANSITVQLLRSTQQLVTVE